MCEEPLYVVDSDVFITAKNLYYGFEICPGFWDCMIHHHHEGQVCSIDQIRTELLAGRKTEDLVLWVKDEMPNSFFRDASDEDVTSTYTQVMLWVQQSAQYFDNAKAQFATGADGWLVAYAKVHDAVVVTNEQPSPEARRRVPLPNVCEHFGVSYTNMFEVLKALSARFVMRA